MKTIGERIVYLRERYDINQKTLAKDIGVTETSLSRYENNLREPKAEVIAKLARRFNTTADFLLGVSNQIYSRKSQKDLELFNDISLLRSESKQDVRRYIDLLKIRDSVEKNRGKKS
jgi:transcriptional regulator with XRE-family HTH domain